MELSKRLSAAAELAARPLAGHSMAPTVADVACDHAYLAIHLVERGIAQRALAMDVRPGPLERARRNVEEAGLTDRIELRLSDGLSALIPGEAQVLILTGIGGPLLVRILTEDPAKSESFDRMILGPQSQIPAARQALRGLRRPLEEEKLIAEEGHYYPLISLGPKTEDAALLAKSWDAGLPRDLEDRYGPRLLASRDPVLKEALLKRREEILRVGLTQNWKETEEYPALLREEYSSILRALALFET